MDNSQVERTIRQYLPQIIHMSIATAGEDGRPWACEVHYAFDEKLNLYWVSVPAARHSRELVANPRIAGTIVAQHAADQPPLGISFEGAVEVLQDVDDKHLAFRTYVGRFPDRKQPVREAYVENDPETSRRIYKVTVSDWYVNGMFDGKLEKLHLAWK